MPTLAWFQPETLRTSSVHLTTQPQILSTDKSEYNHSKKHAVDKLDGAGGLDTSDALNASKDDVDNASNGFVFLDNNNILLGIDIESEDELRWLFPKYKSCKNINTGSSQKARCVVLAAAFAAAAKMSVQCINDAAGTT